MIVCRCTVCCPSVSLKFSLVYMHSTLISDSIGKAISSLDDNYDLLKVVTFMLLHDHNKKGDIWLHLAKNAFK